jgi:hypothetical protein
VSFCGDYQVGDQRRDTPFDPDLTVRLPFQRMVPATGHPINSNRGNWKTFFRSRVWCCQRTQKKLCRTTLLAFRAIALEPSLNTSIFKRCLHPKKLGWVSQSPLSVYVFHPPWHHSDGIFSSQSPSQRRRKGQLANTRQNTFNKFGMQWIIMNNCTSSRTRT